jgi:hypothetical protein
MHVLHNGSTNVITLSHLFDNIDRTYQEGATVVVTLKDESDTDVTGAIGVSMAQVSGTTGRNVLYRGEIAHTVTLPEGTEGSLVVTATNTAGKVRKWTEGLRYED